MDPEEQDGALSALTGQDIGGYDIAPPTDTGSLGGLSMAEYLRREDEDKAAREAELATRKQNFDAYAQALREARAGPTKEERIIQALYAFGAPVPKQGGNFFTALGNAGKSLQATGQEGTAAEAAMKLKLAELGLQESSAVNALNEKYRTASAANRRALAMQTAKQYKTGFNPVTGQLVYLEGPDIGQPVSGAAAQATDSTTPPPTFDMGGKKYFKDQKGNPVLVPEAPPKTMPAAAEVKENEDVAAIQVLTDQNATLQTLYDKIKSGEINLSAVGNAAAKARGVVGNGGKEYADLVDLETTLTKLRNDNLKLNKGPQTDKDAENEWKALIGNLSDEKSMLRSLAKIAEMNKRTVERFNNQVTRRRKNLGLDPLDLSEYQTGVSASPASGTRTKTIKGVTYRNDTGAKDGWYIPK